MTNLNRTASLCAWLFHGLFTPLLTAATPAATTGRPRQPRRAAFAGFDTFTAFAALAVATATLGTAAHAEPARYEIDPDHLSVAFMVEHIGYAKTLGLFQTARGSYSFDETTGALSNVKVEVDTDSVFTNHRKRDEHLRGPDFLNTAQYPRMVFTADTARRIGERQFEITGQLQLLGKTQPVTLQATWNKSAESPIGIARKPYVMGVSARGSFKRSAFGMNYAVANGWVGDEVALILEFEAIRR